MSASPTEAFPNIHQTPHKIPSLNTMMTAIIAAKSVSNVNHSRDHSNRAVIDLLAQWCKDLQMETHIQTVSPGKFNLIAQILPLNLQAQARGLMLAGHTDTVDYSSKWQEDPFQLRLVNGHWIGLGVCDMKGFFPLALIAIARCIEQQQQKHGRNWRAQLQAPITLLATCDEETTMAGARALNASSLQLQGHNVIIGEPSGGHAIYTHKGILTTQIILSGIAGHASNPGLGANAIEAAHWVIGQLLNWRTALQQEFNPIFKVPHPTLSFGCIHGGSNANVICDHCEILLDMRLLPDQPVATLEAGLAQRLQGLEEAVPGTTLTLKRVEHIAPFAENPNQPFFDFLKTTTGLELCSSDFVTEASFLQALGNTPVVYGPGSIEWAHKPNECLPLNRLEPTIKTLLSCLTRVFAP